MTGQSPTPTDLQKMQIGEATDLGTLKRLAEAVETARARYEASPDGSLEESNAYLALDDADDAFDEAGQSATITLTLISLIEAQAAEIEGLKARVIEYESQVDGLSDPADCPGGHGDSCCRAAPICRMALASRTERADG